MLFSGISRPERLIPNGDLGDFIVDDRRSSSQARKDVLHALNDGDGDVDTGPLGRFGKSGRVTQQCFA